MEPPRLTKHAFASLVACALAATVVACSSAPQNDADPTERFHVVTRTPTMSNAAPSSSSPSWPVPDEAEPPRATGVIYDVWMAKEAFTPQVSRIAFGDAVRFHFPPHVATVTSGVECLSDGIFDSDVHQAPFAYTVTFLRPGMYGFFNGADCSMGGVIVVSPPSS